MSTERIVEAILDRAKPAIERHMGAGEAEPALEKLESGSFLQLLAVAGSRESGERLDERALRELAASRGIDPDHAEEALELLRSGKVREDLAGVTAATSQGVDALPESILEFARNPGALVDVVPDLIRDSVRAPRNVFGLIGGWIRGLFGREAEEQEGLFEESLKELYGIAPIDVVRGWAHEVSGYESVQLAILMYANSQGVKLEREHVEAARRALAQDGDLAPLLIAGLDYFESEGPDGLGDFLGA